jgi:hypothetical protein
LVEIDAVLAIKSGGSAPQIIVGKTGNMPGGDPQLSQGYRYIGFSPTVGNFQVAGLQKTLMARGMQAHHDLSEGDDSFNKTD